MNRTVLRSAAHYLNCHQRTIKRRLERLRKRNWIGRFKCGILIIRSFKDLFRIENIGASRTGAVFYMNDLKKVTAFVVSACIGYLVRSQKAKLWREKRARQPGAKKAAPIPPGVALPSSFPVACKYIADIFGISISTASEWKRLGLESGFLSVDKQFEFVGIDNRLEYKRLGYEDDHLIVYRNGSYYRQGIDLVACKLMFKSRRKPNPARFKSGQMPKHNKSLESGNISNRPVPAKYEILMRNRHNR